MLIFRCVIVSLFFVCSLFLCLHLLPSGGSQTTVQLGCWPSQAALPRAWLGQVGVSCYLYYICLSPLHSSAASTFTPPQPSCLTEPGRSVCLCSEDFCNLRLAEGGQEQPEGTMVGFYSYYLLLLLVLPPSPSITTRLQTQFLLVLFLMLLCLVSICTAVFYQCR